MPLIGPNGAGKSSLFRSILGQVPYAGTIQFHLAGGYPAHPKIGYVPRAPVLTGDTPISVLDFFAAISRWPVFLPVPAHLRERVEGCLARVHGEALLHKRIGTLSGGELQRVPLAMALEPIPQILILDEPLSGVDVGEHLVLDMLDEIRQKYDLSILFSTHDFSTPPPLRGQGHPPAADHPEKGTPGRSSPPRSSARCSTWTWERERRRAMSFWYWLVSWLPFEWAAPDTMLFMKNAPAGGAGGHPLFGLLSTMVVESRMAFFSDALGHSAFTGMAIGALCGLAEPVGAAVVFAVVIALLFTLIRQKTHMASDTAISVFSSAAVALGIFPEHPGGQSFTKFNNLLIGDILSVAPGEIGLLALILLGVVILWVTSFNPMMILSSVHQALADSRGIRVVWKNFLFTAAIAVVVTITMTWVGLLVINALLVLPGAAARNVARNLPPVPPGLRGGWAGVRHRGAAGVLLPGGLHRRLHHPALLAVWFFVSPPVSKSR